MKKAAFFGWADLRKGVREGGGYNLVCRQHALGLTNKGFSIFYLQSGTHYSMGWLFGKKPAPGIRKKRRWKKIRLFSLVNSHNRAPALFNMNNLKNQTEDPEQNEIVYKWLDNNGITKVYIHSLEGQAVDLPVFLKSRGIAVRIFCHDHFYICPQVNLLYRGKELCTENKSGKRCESCAEAFRFSDFEKRKASDLIILRQLKAIIKKILKPRMPEPDNEINIMGNNRTLVDNLSPPSCGNFYEKRKTAAIRTLNYADKVFVPSKFLFDVLNKSGVEKKRISLCRISLPHLEFLEKNSTENRFPDSRVKFCFHGTDKPFKGMHFLFNSIINLEKSVKDKCAFLIYGVKKTTYIPPEIRNDKSVFLFPPFNINEIQNHEYDIGILPHLWFENSPITMLEHFALKKPVLCAELGGVTGFIRENKNGWFFKAGDSESLCRKISRIVKSGTLPDNPEYYALDTFAGFINHISEGI